MNESNIVSDTLEFVTKEFVGVNNVIWTVGSDKKIIHIHTENGNYEELYE
jgi:hypothetical protein